MARRTIAPALAALALVLCGCGAGRGDHRPADTATPGTRASRCFGAAARDPAHPCDNPALRLSVVPAPSRAQLDPGAPCRRLKPAGLVAPCVFGAPAGQARLRFALVGDSHAAHLRSAFAAVPRALRWRGVAITRNSCAFVSVGRPLPEPELSECVEWKDELPGWLARHPQVSTLFLGQLTRDVGVDPPGAPDPFAAQVASYVAQWRKLPASVKHIVVIRDTPETRDDTLACVSAAVARGTPPGPACAVSRAAALHRDPAAVAAAQLRSPRLQTVDLTAFFCDARSCYPVVGGALVHRDVTHLTPTFAATLGPFLLQQVRRLSASWGRRALGPAA